MKRSFCLKRAFANMEAKQNFMWETEKREIKDLKQCIKAEVYEILLFFEMPLWVYT